MRDHFVAWVVDRLNSIGISVWYNDTPMADWEIRAFIAPYGNVYFYLAQDKLVWGAGNTVRGVIPWLKAKVFSKCKTVVNPRVIPGLKQYLAKGGFDVTDYIIVADGNLVQCGIKGFRRVPDKMIFAVESFCSSRGYTYAVDDDRIILNVAEVKYEP